MRDQLLVRLAHEDVDIVTGVTGTHRGTVIRLCKQRPAIPIRVLTRTAADTDVECPPEYTSTGILDSGSPSGVLL